MSLLDEWMPRWDVVERHETAVPTSPANAWRALHEANLAPWPVRVLMGLRMLPSAIRSRRLPRAGRVTLRELGSGAFTRLEERPEREVVLGIRGRFWQLAENVVPSQPEDFRRPLPPDLALATWSFAVEERDGGTFVTTETRVLCGGPDARTRFRRYWRVVGPFSGLIRVAMLDAVRRTASGYNT